MLEDVKVQTVVFLVDSVVDLAVPVESVFEIEVPRESGDLGQQLMEMMFVQSRTLEVIVMQMKRMITKIMKTNLTLKLVSMRHPPHRCLKFKINRSQKNKKNIYI